MVTGSIRNSPVDKLVFQCGCSLFSLAFIATVIVNVLFFQHFDPGSNPDPGCHVQFVFLRLPLIHLGHCDRSL